jgi:hypothetical protein
LRWFRKPTEEEQAYEYVGRCYCHELMMKEVLRLGMQPKLLFFNEFCGQRGCIKTEYQLTIKKYANGLTNKELNGSKMGSEDRAISLNSFQF